MKPVLTILTLLAAAVLTGCSEEAKVEIADVIIVSQDRIAFAENGGKATVSVACPSEWTADCTADWITLAADGNSLVISAEANATGLGRTASIALQTGADQKEIQISQAWSEALFQLYVNAPGAIDVISGGEDFTFSVSANCDWSVSLSDGADAWISCSADTQSGIVNVSVAANDGEARSGEITVSPVDAQGSGVSATLTFSQISKAEDPYYRMLGSFDLYAERWYSYDGNGGGGYLPSETIGTAAHCTIEEVEYPETFLIRDLFMDGTEIEATYDTGTQQMTIDLGIRCLLRETADGTTWAYFPVAIDLVSSGFTSKKVTGELGEGVDETGESRPAILLKGFDAPDTAFGLIASNGASYSSIAGIYYADGEMYLVKTGDATVTD